MIITASPFFDENDLLEIRCREMAGLVDAHLIVEANLTYTGQPKPWNFEPERFAAWPIIYQCVELPLRNPDGTRMKAWDREDIHRKKVFEFVKMLHPEVVLYLDIDECPRMSALGHFRKLGVPTARLEMDDLRYRADLVDRSHLWMNPYITLHDPKVTREPGRYNFAAPWPVIPETGWHFCWMGGKEKILNATRAISHYEEDCGIAFAERIAAGQQPGRDRLQPYPTSSLPDCVRANPGKWPILFQ